MKRHIKELADYCQDCGHLARFHGGNKKCMKCGCGQLRVNESANVFTILGWLKRNGDLFDKKELLQQLVSRFHLDKEQALKYIKGKMFEGKMIAFNKYKLDPKEEDALMWLIADKKSDWEKAQSKKDTGKFSKLGTIMDIAKWYEVRGWITQKQLQILEKWKVTSYESGKKESFGGSYARPSNYPIQSGLPQTTVKEAFGFGEEYDAVFIGWQTPGRYSSREPFPLYNVIKKGHPLYGSTVSDRTLRREKLNYPSPPPFRRKK
jgi:hypothetical protein